MAQVEVREAKKEFAPGKPVLAGVSFSVADGEFVSLLGASGCGKTTLLRIVAGLETADSGQILIDGKDVGARSPKDRDIAMVFQNYALYPHLDVAENIAMGLKLRGMPAPEIETRVTDAARRLGLSDFLQRKPSALSGGQRQRVALARALVRKPKVFLLDEPLSNLDAVLREKTRGELKLLFKRVSGTVIYVTHDQIEAMTLSDRIVVMDRGRIEQIGTPYEIYHRPASAFVASFLGSPPMNLFDAGRAAELGLIDGTDVPAGALCGIRPENVVVSQNAGAGLIEAPISLAEPTGAATILSFDLGVSLRAAVASSWDASRASAWIALPGERLHFFDHETRRRLSAERSVLK